VQFDETNGSQVEQMPSIVENVTEALKDLAIGEIKPVEVKESTSSFQMEPATSTKDDESQVQSPAPHPQANVDPHQVGHPRINKNLQRDHPVDQILGDMRKGTQTRSRVANFCEHYSFVSSLEPTKVDDALEDPDWINAMHEELNNFERNQVWTLVERPSQNVIGTKWVFRNKQEEDGQVVRNKARLVAQGYTQVEGLDSGRLMLPLLD
jgi:hypothetical protein